MGLRPPGPVDFELGRVADRKSEDDRGMSVRTESPSGRCSSDRTRGCGRLTQRQAEPAIWPARAVLRLVDERVRYHAVYHARPVGPAPPPPKTRKPCLSRVFKCAEEDSNLHPEISGQGPQPCDMPVRYVPWCPDRPFRPWFGTMRTDLTWRSLSRRLSREAPQSRQSRCPRCPASLREADRGRRTADEHSGPLRATELPAISRRHGSAEIVTATLPPDVGA